MAGIILIKVMTILSTGLFVVTNVWKNHAASLLTLDESIPGGTGSGSVNDSAAIVVNNPFAYGASLLGFTKEYAYQRLKATTCM